MIQLWCEDCMQCPGWAYQRQKFKTRIILSDHHDSRKDAWNSTKVNGQGTFEIPQTQIFQIKLLDQFDTNKRNTNQYHQDLSFIRGYPDCDLYDDEWNDQRYDDSNPPSHGQRLNNSRGTHFSAKSALFSWKATLPDRLGWLKLNHPKHWKIKLQMFFDYHAALIYNDQALVAEWIL